MKYFLLGLLISTPAFASKMNSTPEQFFRAGDKETLIQLNERFSTTTVKKDSASDSESSLTVTELNSEYGINKDHSVGLKLQHNSGGGNTGLGDYEIFLKGQYDKFFYQGSFFYSNGKIKEKDSFVSGGHHFSFLGGYKFTPNYGVKVLLQPAYNYEFENDNSDYEAGTILDLAAYYEGKLNALVYGTSFTYKTIGRAKENSKPFSQEIRYGIVDLYGVYALEHFDIVSRLEYWKSMSDLDDSMEITLTAWNIAARFRF